MSNINASVTMEMLRSIFATHGLPDTFGTDSGLTFTHRFSWRKMGLDRAR